MIGDIFFIGLFYIVFILDNIKNVEMIVGRNKFFICVVGIFICYFYYGII